MDYAQIYSNQTSFKRGNHEVVRRLTFCGMKVAVETDKGQERHWHDKESGEHGSTKMHYPYGYFEGTKASGDAGDGMALDVFVGPADDADHVYVVHQMKKPDFKKFDELKVLVGFESAKQARAAYLSHYNDERFLGTLDTHTLQEFKDKYIAGVSKALDPAAMPPSSGAGNLLQTPNPASAVPQAPAMSMAVPMMPSAPDVDTLEGVRSLLSRVGAMKDPELLDIVELIWGSGYQYVNAAPELVKCETVGFLLDQRDLLEVAKQVMEESVANSQIPESSYSATGSGSASANVENPYAEENSSAMGSQLQ